MKVCCVSDMHGQFPEIPECDFLVISGDICPHFDRPVGGNGDIFGQSQWLYGPFTDWINSVPARHVVACWGNHDFIGEKRPHLVPTNLRWHMLTDAGCEIEGIKFYGSPWQCWFHDWAFNAPPGEAGEIFLANKFSKIPDDTDVIICHGPPSGYGDIAPDGRPTGSKALINRIFEVKPQLTVHGHIHCGYGIWRFPRDNAFDGLIVNASVLDENYKLANKPIMVDMYVKEENSRDRTNSSTEEKPA
jgi:Icc-related predicted phosphoesterase